MLLKWSYTSMIFGEITRKKKTNSNWKYHSHIMTNNSWKIWVSLFETSKINITPLFFCCLVSSFECLDEMMEHTFFLQLKSENPCLLLRLTDKIHCSVSEVGGNKATYLVENALKLIKNGSSNLNVVKKFLFINFVWNKRPFLLKI